MLGDSTTPTRRRGARALGWAAVGSIVALLMLSSASASVLAVVGTSLHQTPPISFGDPEFMEDCSPVGNWHFVLTQTAAASGTLTATFDTGVFVVGSTKKTGGTLHFDVPAGTGATLLGATTDAVGRWLNLSHICGGTTTTTTTTSTTVTTTSTYSSTTTTP